MQAQSSEITRLLISWERGDATALNKLVPLVRRELDVIARRHLQRERRNSVQPSSLVQEALLRLLTGSPNGWQNRGHFYAVVSTVMRHILVDHARERLRQRRGEAAIHIPLDKAVLLSPEQVDEVVAIDLALARLADYDERKSKVFEMRFFAGLSVDETAQALNVSPNTVIRDFNFARAWLRNQLDGQRTTGVGSTAQD